MLTTHNPLCGVFKDTDLNGQEPRPGCFVPERPLPPPRIVLPKLPVTRGHTWGAPFDERGDSPSLRVCLLAPFLDKPALQAAATARSSPRV